MRLGPGEIILIIAIIIAAALITRIVRTGRGTARQNEESAVAITAKPSEDKSNRAHGFFKRAGIAFVLIGIVILLAGMSMFRWALQSYLWSFIIIVIGLVILLLSKKKWLSR